MLRRIDTSRPVAFEVSAGFTARASSASIAFLWSNWEVLFAFQSHKIQALRVVASEIPGAATWEVGGNWEARGFGGKGQWWLERARIGLQHGCFTYFTRAQSLACPLWARTVMEYDRIDETLISYRGTGVAALPRAFRLLHPLLRLLGARITLYINKLGGQVAEIITEHPEKVYEVAGEEAWKTYQLFIKEEQAIKTGQRTMFRYFAEDETSPQATPVLDDILFLKKKLQRIESLLHFKAIDLADYRSSLSIFLQDPHLALVKNRMIVDKIVNLIYDRDVGEQSVNSDLMRRLEDLKKKSLNVPRHILAFMATVADLGDPNCQLPRQVGVLDASAYTISFEATLRVAEWFFTEYLTPESRLRNDKDL
jgi:hypothetical protein